MKNKSILPAKAKNDYRVVKEREEEKAFDTVPFFTLTEKMEHYIRPGAPLNLFNSFLSNCKQYTELQNFVSRVGRQNKEVSLLIHFSIYQTTRFLSFTNC